MSDLSRLGQTIQGVHFPYPILLGGGVVKTYQQVRHLLPTTVIPEWGSIETEPSSGNGGRDYHAEYDEGGRLLFTQNSRGIPNPGMAYVEKHAPGFIRMYDDVGKPLILNVSGKSAEDALELLKRAIECGFKVITVNGACPNKGGLPILCYDHDAVDLLFDRAEQEIGEVDAVIWWKISTGMPRPTLSHNKKRVMESKVFNGVITGNTVPNTLNYDKDGRTTILTEKNKLTRGGMGGPAILPIALDHTEFCAQDIPKDKTVIGCGGIHSAQDAIKYLVHAKAKLVQVVSAYIENGEDPDFISNMIVELYEHYEMNGYPSLV